MAREVLLVARLLADHHHLGAATPLPEHGLRRVLPEVAGTTTCRCRAQRRERTFRAGELRRGCFDHTAAIPREVPAKRLARVSPGMSPSEIPPRGGIAMPPRGVRKGTKLARQYEHIKESERKSGKSTSRAKEIAARTVNKE